MKQVKYNIDKKSLKINYCKEFKSVLEKKQKEWDSLKDTYPFLKKIKCNFSDLLVGNFDMLIRIYLKYVKDYINWKKCNTAVENDKYKKAINGVFNYGSYQWKIARFFMDEKNGFEIHTCHYCETAYINVYSVGKKIRNHFDIDHVLDKGNCPLLGLSLFNFVPSCQCCNEKIKRQETFGDKDPKMMYKLSPTTDKFDFDKNVDISVEIEGSLPPSKGYVKNSKFYGIKFNAKDADYNNYIGKLHLSERYAYHKKLALRMMDLAEDYGDSTIRKIANLLGETEGQIKEDIFGLQFVKDENRCFSKLYRDILKDV